MKQGIIWMEATGLVANDRDPAIASKFLKYIVSPEVAVKLAITEATCNLVPNQKAEALFTPEQKSALQMDYMWTAWTTATSIPSHRTSTPCWRSGRKNLPPAECYRPAC